MDSTNPVRPTDPMSYDAFDRLLRSGPPRAAVLGTSAEILRDIASGKSQVQAVRHPLGFLCFPLVRDGPHGVCLHLFESGIPTEATAAPVHAHSWELTSFVLFGRLTNLRMRVQDRVERPTHRVFEVHSDPSGLDELRPTARLVRSEPGSRLTSGSGDSYALPAGEFHATVVAAESPTATLVLGKSLPGRIDLSLGPLDGRVRREVRRVCDRRQTEWTARTALRRIDAA